MSFEIHSGVKVCTAKELSDTGLTDCPENLIDGYVLKSESVNEEYSYLSVLNGFNVFQVEKFSDETSSFNYIFQRLGATNAAKRQIMMTLISNRDSDATEDHKIYLGNPSNDQLKNEKGEKASFSYFKPKTNDDGWLSGSLSNANFFDGEIETRVSTFTE